MRRSLLVAVMLLLLGTSAYAQQSHLLVVSGLGGEPAHRDAFYQWGVTLVDAARSRHGLPAANVIYLAENPERDPARIQGRSTAENVRNALNELAQRAGPTDQIFILLIGHGSSDGQESRINLPGPDLSDADFAKLLERFPSQKVVLVNTASASGGFIERLSGRNRTIITATNSGFERNETLFGRFFVQALAEEGADVDKDGRVSMLEAFEFARREVARSYREQNRLLTEHALLDDNGDGQGSPEPDVRVGDGAAARTLFLTAGRAPAAMATNANPELRALYEQKRRLEEQIEALKAQKESMPTDRYERELEARLIELARTNQAIRQMEGRQP